MDNAKQFAAQHDFVDAQRVELKDWRARQDSNLRHPD
jgi:hypothetical protein